MIKGIQIKCCPPYGESGGELTDCKKVNFIYGANGSGKTTISEFLRTKDIEGRYNSCEIDWGIGGELPIFVYNRQFRQLNFAQETGIPGVFTLGQNSIKDLEAIQKLKEDLSQKEERYNKTKESIEKKRMKRPDYRKISKKMLGNKFLKIMNEILVKLLKEFEGVKISLFKLYNTGLITLKVIWLIRKIY